MSREIKFRGKVKYNGNHKFMGEWVYGYYRNNQNGNAFITETLDELENYIFEETEVEEETIGQFTGLYDKNGKEIYEGDIVQIDDDVAEAFEIKNKGKIEYLGGIYLVTYKNEIKLLQSLFALVDVNNIFRGEVIGNIYDNPELLEANND